MTLIRGDNGYKAGFTDYVSKTYDWLVDISRGRPVKSQNPLKALFGKWGEIERSEGWLNFRRRLSIGLGENPRTFGGQAPVSLYLFSASQPGYIKFPNVPLDLLTCILISILLLAVLSSSGHFSKQARPESLFRDSLPGEFSNQTPNRNEGIKAY
jgi:hypothetical protein